MSIVEATLFRIPNGNICNAFLQPTGALFVQTNATRVYICTHEFMEAKIKPRDSNKRGKIAVHIRGYLRLCEVVEKCRLKVSFPSFFFYSALH
ncbi:hypothetical protein POVCU2_0012770 [Plasmodium ovale curtisi]|uniref:Uncharacterized protein n=1 Tax=Plasmodium ovale curtisi TaxID=864141 RepID=A0A1A8VQH1_PLAOA|nr:hypothetical protein POVCU2_0012770 [Plasmodium ovale curtisi]SBS85047.1 hypothetical protein POVCU1_011850 [Plasmodium ovale curtisi]